MNNQIQNSFHYFLGLKVSDDVLATIIITISIFLIGGIIKFIYNSIKNWNKKNTTKKLITTSINSMETRITKQIEYLDEFIELLKNKNLKSLKFSYSYPFQLRVLKTIPYIDLFSIYKNEDKIFSEFITNVFRIDSIYKELKSLFTDAFKTLKKIEKDWYDLIMIFNSKYDYIRIESDNNDEFIKSIRTIYLEWIENIDTKDLTKALEFNKKMYNACRAYNSDKRAIKLIHITNDIMNAIRNYQSKTINYSDDFKYYKENLDEVYNNLKNTII